MGCGYSVCPQAGSGDVTTGRKKNKPWDPAANECGCPGGAGGKDVVDGYVAEVPCDPFHDTLVSAARQIHLRQRKGVASLGVEEVEDIVVLSRELDNLRAMLEETKCTVLGSWKVVEEQGKANFLARCMYDDMLANNVEMREIFYNIDVEEQSRVLGRVLATAVHFYGKQDVLQQMFSAVGARHRSYGVETKHIGYMQEAFFRHFPSYVGDDMFAKCKEDWRQFWCIVLEAFERGSKSREGEKFGLARRNLVVKQLQENFAAIQQRQQGIDAKKQFIAVMFSKVAQLDGRLSYLKSLEDDDFRSRLFEFLVGLFNALDSMETVKESTRECGAYLVSFNIQAQRLFLCSEPFVDTCHHFLADKWDMVMESRFRWAWSVILEGLASGMEEVAKRTLQTRGPDGSEPFCLVFTGVEGNTSLWGANAEVKKVTTVDYQDIVRSTIASYGGFEVKVAKNSSMIACENVFVGMKIALAIQLELMRLDPIAPGFTMLADAEGGGDPSCWRGGDLRVKGAVQHCVDVIASYDAIHQRYNYYGTCVNYGSRMQRAACGGEILLSKASFAVLEAIPEFTGEPCPSDLREMEVVYNNLDSRGLNEFISVKDIGLVDLQDIPESVHLVSVTPKVLSGKTFCHNCREH